MSPERSSNLYDPHCRYFHRLSFLSVFIMVLSADDYMCGHGHHPLVSLTLDVKYLQDKPSKHLSLRSCWLPGVYWIRSSWLFNLPTLSEFLPPLKNPTGDRGTKQFRLLSCHWDLCLLPSLPCLQPEEKETEKTEIIRDLLVFTVISPF